MSNQINCPNCGHGIDVNDLLHQQVDAELKQQYHDSLAKEKAKIQTQQTDLATQQAILEQEKQTQSQQVNQAIQAGLQQKEAELKKVLQLSLKEENNIKFKSLEDEVKEKSGKLKGLHQAQADLAKLQREKDELHTSILAESEKKLNQQIVVEREKIQKSEADKNELKFKELEKQLNDQKNLTEEMKRKQEQGSMQLQGETQELAIEEWLAENFPLDTIEEIKKGARGADCLQIVHTRAHQNCGTIYYESKRTKSFQADWIAKFKNDIKDKNADIGVLVTETMPLDMDRMGLREGIWICSFDEFKALCAVLRESLIRLSTAIITQENKGDKMGMLYDFLTSNEFSLQIEAIVDGFSQMQTDLDTEKRAMARLWKQREKQLQKVLLNTTEMYGSIKGIAGNAVQSVPTLELPIDITEE